MSASGSSASAAPSISWTCIATRTMANRRIRDARDNWSASRPKPSTSRRPNVLYIRASLLEPIELYLDTALAQIFDEVRNDASGDKVADHVPALPPAPAEGEDRLKQRRVAF